MSLAIKFGKGLDSEETSGFIYIDAVTHYTREFKGSLSSHPIANGGVVSDHFVRNNPMYNITGVISGADISIDKVWLKGESGEYPINVSPVNSPPVTIKGNNKTLLSLLPESFSQFFVDPSPSVVTSTTNTRRDVLTTIRLLMEGLFKKDGLSLITLYEYKDNKLDKLIDPLVMTSLSFTEDPDSGVALYINMTLEEVTFAGIRTTLLDKKEVAKLNAKNVSKETKNAAAAEDKKGNQQPPASIALTKEQKEAIEKALRPDNVSILETLNLIP